MFNQKILLTVWFGHNTYLACKFGKEIREKKNAWDVMG
jgi:hypothetical protein